MKEYQYTFIGKFKNGDFAFDVFNISKKHLKISIKNGRVATKKDKDQPQTDI